MQLHLPLLANEEINKLHVLASLETEVREWHRRLKAAQQLRLFYQNSEFAVTTIKEKEQEFKKRWWKACNSYQAFKKTHGI